jgi:hypothetical protein
MDNIKMDLVVKGWYIVDCIGFDWRGLGKEQVESSCECGNKPLGSIKCWETIQSLHNWRAPEKCSAL